MESNKEIPELLRMMFGEQAYPMRATAGERLMGWAEAFEAWLAEKGWEVESITPIRHVARTGAIWPVR